MLRLALSGEFIDSALQAHVLEISMVRTEYLYRQIGEYVTTQAGKRHVSEYLKRVSEQAAERQIWIRTADFEAREIAVLNGCDATVVDENPLLGERGVRRGQMCPEAFFEEVSAYARLQTVHGGFGLLFSYVPDVSALDFAIAVARAAGWKGPLGCMIETPSAVIEYSEFVQRPLDRAVLGMNDLTTLMLGAARNSPHWKKDCGVLLKTLRGLADQAKKSNAQLFAAGNFTPPEFEAIRNNIVDDVIVHYSELSALFPIWKEKLSFEKIVPAIKRRTAEALTKGADSAIR